MRVLALTWLGVLFVLTACGPGRMVSYAQATELAMLAEPQVAISVPGVSPKAPTNLVVIACRVDDLTGQPGRLDPTLLVAEGAHLGWRDLEWHVADGELECKREVSELQDAAVVLDNTGKLAKPLNSNFGDLGQCVHAGAYWAVEWDRAHRGWATMAVGCPVPIVDARGVIKAWKMPDCPRRIGKIEGIRCKFDESVI